MYCFLDATIKARSLRLFGNNLYKFYLYFILVLVSDLTHFGRKKRVREEPTPTPTPILKGCYINPSGKWVKHLFSVLPVYWCSLVKQMLHVVG